METKQHTNEANTMNNNTNTTNNTDTMTTRDLLKKAWIQSGAYRTESLTAYTNRVMSVNS